MKRILIFIYFAILYFCFPFFFSSEGKQIRINEFLIEPFQSIELVNISSDSADISGWFLDDSGGTTYYSIPQHTTLFPHACMVFTSDFNLNKSSQDTIRLFSNNASPTSSSAVLVDSYTYKSSDGQYISYARLPDGENIWATVSANLGKWNSSGENCVILPSLTPSPSPSPEPTASSVSPTPSPTPTQAPLDNIFISETMTYPDEGGNEWIELYNDNDFEVHLTDWYIDDIENAGSTPKSFSATIPAKNYTTISFESSLFNNNGDTVRLMDMYKKQRDGFEYGKTTRGLSWGRTAWESDMLCLQTPSKGMVNNPCIQEITIAPSLSPSKPKARQNLSSSYIPTKIYVANKNLLPVTKQEDNAKGAILGISDTLDKNQTKQRAKSPVKHLSFVSFSYSILTILSVFFKIKNAI